MAAPLSVTAPSSVQNLMNSSPRRSMVSRGVLMIETRPFIWTNLNPNHSRMICAKFGWNGPSGSGEEVQNVKSLQTDGQTKDNRWSEKLTWASEKLFHFPQCIFTILVMISPWKRKCPFLWTNLNFLHPLIYSLPGLVEISTVVLEIKIF